MSLRLAFMTGQYPRATDTFIQREVSALRELGHHVQTFSVRMPPDTEQVGAETLAERKSTIYLLPPRKLVTAHIAQILSSPRQYFEALVLAWKTCPPGIAAIARQAASRSAASALSRPTAHPVIIERIYERPQQNRIARAALFSCRVKIRLTRAPAP